MIVGLLVAIYLAIVVNAIRIIQTDKKLRDVHSVDSLRRLNDRSG